MDTFLKKVEMRGFIKNMSNVALLLVLMLHFDTLIRINLMFINNDLDIIE